MSYAIMQEAGPSAQRRTRPWHARPKRRGTVSASGQVEALGDFVHDTYLATGKRSYGGHRFEWRSARSLSAGWHPWDGKDDPGTRGREWSAVITLRNGAAQHEVRLYAWKEAR